MKLQGFPRFIRSRAALALALAAMAGSAAHAGEPLQDAQGYAKQGQWAPALQRIDQHLAARPKDSQARLLKGVILNELNRPNDALAVFSKLAEDYPELPEPHNNMAVIYAQQKQFDKARAALIAALKTSPSYSTAHDNLGDVYARLASQAYDKALQTDSSTNAPGPKLSMLRAVATLPKAEMVVARAPAPAPASVPAPPPVPAKVAATSAPQLAPPPAPLAPVAPASASKPIPPPVKPASATAAPDKSEKPNADAARQEVGRTILAWAAAWSRKDVKAYLGHYAREFQPPGRQSRSAWEAERTRRVGKPGKIEVRVDDLRVALDGETATAYFRQHYNSANLDSSGYKVLVLVKREGRWQIQQERVGRQ